MTRFLLVLGLTAYTVLASLWVLRLPVFEAPDELGHAQFVQRVADGAALPVVLGTTEQTGQPVFHQSPLAHHPPLYYLVLGGFLRALGADGLRPTPAQAERRAGDPKSTLIFAHGHDELPPVSPEVRRFRLLRGVSVLLGLVLLMVTARLARETTAQATGVPATSVLLLAGLPTFSIAHAGLDNGNPAALLATVVLLLLVRSLRDRSLGLGRALLLGGLLGAGLLTKLTVIYLPGLFVACAWFLWRAGARGPALRMLAAAVTGVACLLPFVLRNLALYGEPLAVQVHEAAFESSLLAEGQRLRYVLELLPLLTLGSLVAGVGWLGSASAMILFGLFAALVLAASAGGLRRRPGGFPVEGAAGREVLVLLVLAVLGSMAVYMKFNLTFMQAQGRYLLSALPPLAVLLGIGLEHWRATRVRIAILCVLLSALPVGLRYQDEWIAARFAFDATGKDPYRSILTAGMRSESGVALDGVRPLETVPTEPGPPTLRWEQGEARSRPLSMHLFLPDEALTLGSYELRAVDVGVVPSGGSGSIAEFVVPDVLWDILESGHTLRWKLREVPDRSLGETAERARETPWQVVRKP